MNDISFQLVFIILESLLINFFVDFNELYEARLLLHYKKYLVNSYFLS